MANLIHSINVTLSGNCYHEDAVADEQHHQYAIDLLGNSEALLLGRNTFELFSSFWPSAAGNKDLPHWIVRFANELERKQKYVVSSREIDTTWRAVERIEGPNLSGVQQLLNSIRGNVLVFGSPGLGASLVEAGLVDEIHILCQPIISVSKPRAFDGLNSRATMKLLEAKPFSSGAVLLRYSYEG